MGRWLSLFLLLVVVTGSILHFHLLSDSPWLTWLGELPGDLMIKKGETTLYLPLTSSLLISITLSLILSALFKR